MPEPPGDTYGVRRLTELYREWTASGMVANIGTRLIEVAEGRLVLEGNLTAEAHGFPTSLGPVVHGGALATLADEALASVAFTAAREGETTATADLKVDFLRPAIPGRLIARARLKHRTGRLAFCEASVEQADGQVVVEARALIAYVKV
ncbi:MAG: PaaI family thioesterase [Candidatus Dormibacterales bacterium]